MSKKSEKAESEPLEDDPVAMNPVIVDAVALEAMPPANTFLLTRRVAASVDPKTGRIEYWNPDPSSSEHKLMVKRGEIDEKHLEAFVRSGALKPIS